MPNYSMNIGDQGIEQDRTCEDVGFSLDAHGVTPAQTAYHSLTESRGDLPGELASPLADAINYSNNSKMIDVGPSAGEITGRTRNG